MLKIVSCSLLSQIGFKAGADDTSGCNCKASSAVYLLL